MSELDQSYEQIILIGLAFLLAPAAVLSWSLRPKPAVNFFRGGEAAVCLAIAIDALRRLLLIGGGTPVTFPPDTPLPATQGTVPGIYMAVVNVTMISTTAFLLWMRVQQTIRHRVRNRETEKQFLDELTTKDD